MNGLRFPHYLPERDWHQSAPLLIMLFIASLYGALAPAIDSGKLLLGASPQHVMSAKSHHLPPTAPALRPPPAVPLPAPEPLETGAALESGFEKYRHLVEHYAGKFQISPSLIYAIIKAESNFDPLATSHASAYGLMQVVPRSGGRDAYRSVYGQDLIPSKEYLHDPERNIELGTAYLSLLARKFFAGVNDPLSREYCQIAAYNTGARRVLLTFGFDYENGLQKINSLSPTEVFEHLKQRLPYRETRKYLPKVVNFKREFKLS